MYYEMDDVKQERVSISQSIKVHLFSAMCCKQIGDCSLKNLEACM